MHKAKIFNLEVSTNQLKNQTYADRKYKKIIRGTIILCWN